MKKPPRLPHVRSEIRKTAPYTRVNAGSTHASLGFVGFVGLVGFGKHRGEGIGLRWASSGFVEWLDSWGHARFVSLGFDADSSGFCARRDTMWSRFEKLKDNITQIASDVLDSQDEELDGEEFDDGHYNGALQSVHLRDSDGDDEPPEARAGEVRASSFAHDLRFLGV